MNFEDKDIIYDWNFCQGVIKLNQPVTFFDETLRDGIQSPSVRDPSIEEKLKILHLMEALGIQCADIGLPGAGPRARADVKRILEEIRDSKMKIKPACAGRTVAADIQPIVDLAQEVGIEVEVMAFIGSSSIRVLAEHWDGEKMQKLTAEAVELCRRNNLPCCYVTEDTIRSHPDTLRQLFLTALEHGAVRLALCDTVGHASPNGVKGLIEWTRTLLNENGFSDVLIDWHGHNDRGLALVNALFAAEHGAERIHGTGLGIGERVGNTALDQVLINMKLLGWIGQDLSALTAYCEAISQATGVPIPVNYPVIGADAFRTATGVHAAAVIKAEKTGATFLADRIYSGVPASWVGRRQEIAIGHMSGESNVIYWLQTRGITPDAELVEKIFTKAKACNSLLTDQEIGEVVHEYGIRK